MCKRAWMRVGEKEREGGKERESERERESGPQYAASKTYPVFLARHALQLGTCPLLLLR